MASASRLFGSNWKRKSNRFIQRTRPADSREQIDISFFTGRPETSGGCDLRFRVGGICEALRSILVDVLRIFRIQQLCHIVSKSSELDNKTK